MSLPVDTSKVSFVAGTEADPVMDWEKGVQRLSRDGQPIYSVQIVALPDVGLAEVIKVKVLGAPKGLRRHAPIKVTGLETRQYTMDGNERLSYWASAIEPEAQPREGVVSFAAAAFWLIVLSFSKGTPVIAVWVSVLVGYLIGRRVGDRDA